MHIVKKLFALMLVAALCASCSSRVQTAPSEAPEYEPVPPSVLEPQPSPSEPPPVIDNSLEAITSNIDLVLPQQLTIARPEEDTLETSAANYYLTGSSNPEQPLLLNGELVESRGQFGTFAIFVPLDMGENTFTFEQGGENRIITITRVETAEYSLTDRIASMRPEINAATRSGEEYLLSCIAPSGAEVTAAVGEQVIPLEQSAATAVKGVPATFRASYIPDEVDGTVDLGPVVYTLYYNGDKTDFVSAGNLYAVGSEATLVVRGTNAASTLFSENSEDSAYYSMLVDGAVDSVATISSSLYQLSMGGWIKKDAVEIVTEPIELHNAVSKTAIYPHGKYETLVLTGTAPAPYRAQWDEDVHSITLYNTSLSSAELAIDGSELLSSIETEEADGNTTLRFTPQKGVQLSGYLVEYDGTNTLITWRVAPQPVPGGLPLEGITVLLDPGHGGEDIGARGALWNIGPVEKQINLEAALVTRRYLQNLGAEVLMTRDSDTRNDMNDVIRMVRNPEVDFVVSLHCNSIDPAYDGTSALGVETYYFDPISSDFAVRLAQLVSDYTGRKNRAAKNSHYRMTLSTGAPAVLLEMGFATNPVEYDSLCAKENLYATAEAIAQAILETEPSEINSPAE